MRLINKTDKTDKYTLLQATNEFFNSYKKTKKHFLFKVIDKYSSKKVKPFSSKLNYSYILKIKKRIEEDKKALAKTMVRLSEALGCIYDK